MKIHKAILLGLVQKFAQVFQLKPEQIILTTRTDRAKLAAEASKQATGQSALQFPRVYLVPTSVGLYEQGYDARRMQLTGVYVNGTDDGTTLKRMHIIPVQMRIEVFYQTQNGDLALDFAFTWLSEAVIRKALGFTLSIGSVPIDVKASSEDTEVAIPEQPSMADDTNPYTELQTSLIVVGMAESSLKYDDQDEDVPIVRQSVINLDATLE